METFIVYFRSKITGNIDLENVSIGSILGTKVVLFCWRSWPRPWILVPTLKKARKSLARGLAYHIQPELCKRLPRRKQSTTRVRPTEATATGNFEVAVTHSTQTQHFHLHALPYFLSNFFTFQVCRLIANAALFALTFDATHREARRDTEKVFSW